VIAAGERLLLNSVFNTKGDAYAKTAYSKARLAANWPRGKSLKLRYLTQDEATGMYVMGMVGSEVLWTYDVNQAIKALTVMTWSTAVDNLRLVSSRLRRTDLRIATAYV
jgi:hypothetical protein